MKLSTLLLTFCCLFTAISYSQNNQAGIHETQSNYYKSLGQDYSYYESQENEIVNSTKANCNLNKVVYGWHPYWSGSAYQNYQWDLLSHFSYFSYEVDAADGQPNTTNGWATSAAVNAALASGNTKVTLCVTLFSGHTTFFASATSMQTLITNLINLVGTRGAHGVNIDFEGIPSSQRTNFANFMVDLANQMHAVDSTYEVSTVLYAVDWNSVFDFSIMEPAVDQYIIMGYAYYYGGSSTAGPTDPLYHFGSSYNYTLSRSITYYLDLGCPKEKLILGLPEYGYEWQTSTLNVPSSTAASGYARTYAYVMNNTSGNYSAANYIWESDSYSDVYAFNNGVNRQCFITQDSAWRKRLEHVVHSDIGGIGIWALGYDNGYTGLWDGMNDYLTDCFSEPCSGTIHDFGGPTKNYYNDEDYTWTIAPQGASTIDLDFTLFNVEANFDYLYVYDGNSTASPQITGSPFTGTVGPGTFSTTSGAVTFRFTSDGATVAPGFVANYVCSSIPAPIASFSPSATTICVGDSLQLVSTSSDATSFLWTTSAGGLSNSSAENPYLFANSTGNYSITLIVNNATGADTITNSLNIVVNQAPVADASASATTFTLPNATVFFTNSSSNASSYFWNFADGTTSTDANPWHTFTTAGQFNVMLVAMNAGCANDTTYFTIDVGTIGLSELENAVLSVAPNPFSDEFIIHSTKEISEIKLIDSRGANVPISWAKKDGVIHINAERISKGIYILQVTTGNELVHKRIVKN
ncbi:MAG: T9SS type A sorting domain-containing protein [Fluviicola sp.]|nr:T9SS type A sorting domain-containing protein [Fluviicola sp.]